MEQLKRVSKIEDDVLVLMASYACPIKDQVYQHFVRGVRVYKLSHWTKEAKGNSYQLCIFPDNSQQWVNKENLRSFKVERFAGGNK